MRIAVALLLLLQAGAAARTGIQGVVVGAGTEPPYPLVNARVELARVQPGVNVFSPEGARIERTDASGKFTFTGIPSGQYRLRITRDGYLRKEYGEFSFDEPGPPIFIASGQRTDVNIALDPAPGIFGRISDEQGEGIPNVLVRAFRVSYDARGARRITPEFSAQTDDHGEYRLYWIDPGEYYIGAEIVPDPIFDNPNEPPPAEGYTPTYYPGLTDPADVATIRITLGAQAAGMDFRMMRDPALREKRVTLRGDVLLDRSDLPGRSRVTIEPNGNVSAVISRDESTEGNGSFEIRGVEPGDYTLVAQAVRSTGRGLARETGFVRVVVRNQDVEGIRIVPTASVRLPGAIVVESRSGPFRDMRDLGPARITLQPLLSPLPPATSGSPTASGQFIVDRFFLGGEYTLSVSDLPADFYLKSARLAGTDILESGIFRLNFQSASDLLEIALGTDGGSLKGSVYARDSDHPVPRAKVVLAPESKRRRLEQYRHVVADNVGNFIIRGIPPGKYSLFAWKRLETNAYLNADFLATYQNDGQYVEIATGENKPIGLRAIPER